MTNENSKKTASANDVIKKYISTKKILIADPGAASRSALFAVCKDLGASAPLITLVNNFEQAEEFINKEMPHIVIADFNLGKRCGLDLFRTQRERRPQETKQCLFIIVTGNSSQASVARACEEDIDAYILKPFTQFSVRSNILKAAIAKIQPSDYQQTIDKGKEALQKLNFDEAESLFKKAKTMNSQPTTACYFLGQVDWMKKVPDSAKLQYQEGLTFNKIHYRCLVGLYDLLVSKNEPVSAYEVVKKISQYFPANPKRLAEVMKLAIATQQYEDIEKYYAVFTNLDDRDDTLIRYVCAALTICAKHYLSTNLGHSRALELLRKAAVTAGSRTPILREIVFVLTDHGLGKEAEYFISRIPPEHQSTDDYQMLNFLADQSNPSLPPTPELGKKLILAGVRDERLYRAIIQGYLKKNRLEDAQDVVADASQKIPEKKAEFEALLKTKAN